MTHLHIKPVVARGLLGAVLAAVLVAVPVGAFPGPDPGLPAVSPPAPMPEPGETQIPPAGNAGEDDMPASQAERRRVLAELQRVADCVRAQGFAIPDPVSDAEGVHLGWDGPPRPRTEAAIARCARLGAASRRSHRRVRHFRR